MWLRNCRILLGGFLKKGQVLDELTEQATHTRLLFRKISCNVSASEMLTNL